MKFYPSILPWYDQIFPFSSAQRDFVLSFGANPSLHVVDVGCGTGSLILSLSKVFRYTAGWDPDGAMLDAARRKALAAGAGTWFIQAGMLDLETELDGHSVDRLLCFGNTLPHLADEPALYEFARQAARVLKPGGLILLQIINYDRILYQKLGGLPAIETDDIRFERFYEYPDNPSHVQFKTRLTVKSTGDVIENEVPLLALRSARLRQILLDFGFSAIEVFGSFTKDPFSPEAQPFIITARI